MEHQNVRHDPHFFPDLTRRPKDMSFGEVAMNSRRFRVSSHGEVTKRFSGPCVS